MTRYKIDMNMIAAKYSSVLHADNTNTLKQELADIYAAAEDTSESTLQKLRNQAPDNSQM